MPNDANGSLDARIKEVGRIFDELRNVHKLSEVVIFRRVLDTSDDLGVPIGKRALRALSAFLRDVLAGEKAEAGGAIAADVVRVVRYARELLERGIAVSAVPSDIVVRRTVAVGEPRQERVAAPASHPMFNELYP